MSTGNSIKNNRIKNASILYVTENGRKLGERLKSLLPEAEVVRFDSGIAAELWQESDHLIFIMATGIAVRTIAPLLNDKRTDPAVVVLDERGKFAISLAGGHIAGANDLATDIARFLGGEPIITTASDVNDLPAIDLWARDNDLAIENWSSVPQMGVRLIDNGILRVYVENDDTAIVQLPEEFVRATDPNSADMIISTAKNLLLAADTAKIGEPERKPVCDGAGCAPSQPVQLYLRPRTLVVGIGCNKGTPEAEIEEAVAAVFDERNLSMLSIRNVATIDIKLDESGLAAFAKNHALEIHTFTAGELNSVKNIERSETVYKATGAHAVAEPAAMLAADETTCKIMREGSGACVYECSLLIPKQKKGNATVAVAKMAVSKEMVSTKTVNHDQVSGESAAEASVTISATAKMAMGQAMGQKVAPKIYVVGTGPGSADHITPYAQEAIRSSDIIVGYGTYLDLIPELISGKKIVSTGMTGELDRCVRAVDLALLGKTVSVISGGDPGIYAMAGLVFEVLKEKEVAAIRDKSKTEAGEIERDGNLRLDAFNAINIEVVPGISALNACASRLGAPLMHDFASISLSDRLTEWSLIERRLEAAAVADFVIALYNPRSKGRPDHIKRAREIILQHRSPLTPVGIVKGAMRDCESTIISDLDRMLDHEIDMQTTIIIGNATTFVWEKFMVTPRGYRHA